MRYTIIKQYYKSEVVCAEFCELNDATIFMNKLAAIHIPTNPKAIYWIFDNGVLMSEPFNKMNNQNAASQFVQGNKEITPVQEPFNVIVFNNTAKAEITLAKFAHLKDAKIFVEMRLLDVDNIDDDNTYFIFDGDKLLEKCDKSTLATNSTKSEKKKVFRPTPLPTVPRLGPGGYWVDEDEDKDKN